MSQSDVLSVLEKSQRPLSRSEIARALNDNDTHVSHSIQRLIKGRAIKIMEIDRKQAMEHYRCKRRMRLYYV